MLKYAGSMARYPARALFGWYLSVIVLGGVVLSLPIARAPAAEPIRLIDALFTSTSAVCVTGLTVRSTGQAFSPFGQGVILLLFQFGGIGIMTLTTFTALALTGHASLRQFATISETLGVKPSERLARVLVRVIGVTLAFEAVGVAALMPRFLGEGQPAGQALWQATFHSVSAFCNAGFGLYDDSLVRYQGDAWVNIIIMLLIVVGGIGFPVLTDLGRHWPRREPGETYRAALARGWDGWQPTTKLVLIVTASFIVVGALLILVLEWHHGLADMPWYRRPLVALFQSVTTRTAGFNTVPIERFTSATLFIMILWMFVGGGPCSTAGGSKVSTFGVLALLAWHRLLGHGQVILFRRSIARATVERAILTILLFVVFAIVGMAGILVAGEALLGGTGPQAHEFFLDAAFEVVSALGTVGLSLGITPTLSDGSKLFLMLLMFAGRLGPISVLLAVSRGERDAKLQYAKQEVLIG
ncbi:MAG: TrkH family potassium uptake protein [Gemmataceae bacterium]